MCVERRVRVGQIDGHRHDQGNQPRVEKHGALAAVNENLEQGTCGVWACSPWAV